MYYQVISPFYTQIEGDTLAEAIKMFVKVNYNNQIRNMIIADQSNRYNASINYYSKNNKNKIGIEVNKDTGYVVNKDIGYVGNKDTSYTVYPNNNVLQPIYKENDNGTTSEIVSMGLPLNLSPVNLQPNNSIKVSPIITAPGLISTTNTGIVAGINGSANSNIFSANNNIISANNNIISAFPGINYLSRLNQY
jgi:hypothetical protein